MTLEIVTNTYKSPLKYYESFTCVYRRFENSSLVQHVKLAVTHLGNEYFSSRFEKVKI